MQMAVRQIDQNLEHFLGQADIAAQVPDPVTHWVMVLIRPGFEQAARDGLRRRGVGAWWPNYQKEEGAKDPQTGKRFKRLVLSSVLPGVLLSPARLDTRFWAACDASPGIVNVARKTNTDPIVLNDTDIALIHAIEVGLNKAPQIKSTIHSYATGESVRFIDDEFRRLPAGKVTKCDRDGHITVEVNMMGRMIPVKVLAFQIEPVDADAKNQSASKSTDARERSAKSPSRR